MLKKIKCGIPELNEHSFFDDAKKFCGNPLYLKSGAKFGQSKSVLSEIAEVLGLEKKDLTKKLSKVKIQEDVES